MIKHKCMGIVFAVVVLLAGVSGGVARTSQIAADKVETALNPWTVEILERDTEVRDISIAIGGFNQYPLISFTKPDGDDLRIFLAVPALDKPGDFGPGNKWRLVSINIFSPEVSKVSAVAAYTTQDKFKVGWAYRSGPNGDAYITVYEFNNHLDIVIRSSLQIINFSDEYSGWNLDEKPSLEFDSSGKPHLAVRLYTTTPFNRQIVYAYPQSNPSSPCGSTGYQCDRIISGKYLSAPVLKFDSNDNPRISYIVGLDNELSYAYPQTNPQFHPNCGPGGNTWRCIVMTGGPGEGEIGPLFSMAVGSEASHLAYTQKDSLNQVWLHSASFVGSGGNCGYDYALTQLMPPEIDLIPRWKCTQLFSYGMDPLYTAVTVGVDQDNYPVLAFNESAGLNFILTVAFPSERTDAGPTSGNCGPGANTWTCIKVDGRGINTGKNAALALKDDGRGFIVYIEDEEYSPNLMIAYQQRYVFLPMVLR